MTPGSSEQNSKSSFPSIVSQFIDKNQLIQTGDIVIVAVSGGRDSIALLHLLYMLSFSRAFQIQAVHVDHGIRGDESAADAQLVKDICLEKKIRLDMEKLSGFTVNTSEEKLRTARYGVFERVLRKYPGAKLATAHHLNDQLETVMMRLFKGSSVKGLRGIPVKRDRFIRPFLSVSREQISLFCREIKLEYREDKSNTDPGKLRNRIRHELIPLANTIFGQDSLDSFEKSRQKIADFYSSFQDVCRPDFQMILKSDRTGYFCSIKVFLGLDLPRRAAFLDYCFYMLYNLNLNFAVNRLKELSNFLHSAVSGSFFFMSNTIWVLKDRSQFYFVVKEKKKTQPAKLFPGNTVRFGQYELSLEPASAKEIQFFNNPDMEYICGDDLQLPLHVRTWRTGDWFRPFGQKGKQKLSDYFINMKLNVLQKEQVPLVYDAENLVWVAGMRLDARYKTDNNCRMVYLLKINERKKC